MEKILLVLAISLLSGLATYYISHVLQKGSVLGSAIIVLVSGIVFPSVFGSAGTTMAVAATAASYAGMVSKDNVVSLLEMSLVSMLCGVIFLVTTPAFTGVGGKLGTVAAIACLSFKGLKGLYLAGKRVLLAKEAKVSFQKALEEYCKGCPVCLDNSSYEHSKAC